MRDGDDGDPPPRAPIAAAPTNASILRSLVCLDFFSSSVYTGKTADPLTERLRVELESLRQTVDEKERTSERDAARGDTYDLLRRGLMANAGQSASGSFCVGGNPL